LDCATQFLTPPRLPYSGLSTADSPMQRACAQWSLYLSSARSAWRDHCSSPHLRFARVPVDRDAFFSSSRRFASRLPMLRKLMMLANCSLRGVAFLVSQL